MKTPWQRSPYGLIQEDLRQRSWAMLVACIMLNRATGGQVRPVLEKFLDKWPDNGALLREITEPNTYKVMRDILRPLGFQNVRTKRITFMTIDYVMKSVMRIPYDASGLESYYGIGKYAVDSYKIFVEGHIPEDGQLEDKELRRFAEWARSRATADDDR